MDLAGQSVTLQWQILAWKEMAPITQTDGSFQIRRQGPWRSRQYLAAIAEKTNRSFLAGRNPYAWSGSVKNGKI